MEKLDGLLEERHPSGRARWLRRSTRDFTLRAWAALIVVVLVLVVIGLALNRNLHTVDRLVERMLRVEEPISAAAHEMEINVIGSGLAIWKYVATGAAEHRERVSQDRADFQRFRGEYDRLMTTAGARDLGERLDALYEPYCRLGDAIMDTRDEFVARLGEASDAFDAIDRILDDSIQPGIAPDSPAGVAKLLTSTALEADVAECGAWLGVYLADSTEEHRQRILESTGEARHHLAVFSSLELTPEERLHANSIERILDPTQALIDHAVGLHDSLRRHETEFTALRNQLDDLLDEGIQVLARQDLGATQLQSKSAIHRLYVNSLIVLVLGAVVCIGAASLLAYHSVKLQSANRELRQEFARRQDAEAARNLLQHELVAAEEKERGRLSRELHDQMGQNLSTLLLGLKGLSRTASFDGRAPAGSDLVQLQELTGRLVQQVHTIAWELRPATLDELGVQGALTNYLEEWTQSSAVEVDFESNLDNQRLPDPIEIALYRVAQEALTNVAKHARAKNVSLTLLRRDQEVVMVVEDDGAGFDSEKVLTSSATKGHLGVLGMKERIALTGGAFQVESAPGRGTTLVVRIPLV